MKTKTWTQIFCDLLGEEIKTQQVCFKRADQIVVD
jgi:hypothetical protein